jgi:restriction endonuclease S subunit
MVNYFLNSKPWFDEVLRYATGTTRPRISRTRLEQLEVPVPPLAEQERLVKLLDEADELRKLRARADRRTAELIPALFYEMFGDPSTNPKGWPKGGLGDFCELNNGFPFKPTDWDGIGLPIIRIQNLNDRAKPFNSTSKVLPDKFLVRRGDILLSWSGTPGTSFGCFRWDGPTGWLNQHIFNVRLDPRLEGDFFIHSVNARLGELIAKAHGGVGLQHVTKGILNSVELLVPPLSLQKSFSNRVEDIRKLEADQAASRLRLEALFQSMLHRAFNGEL